MTSNQHHLVDAQELVGLVLGDNSALPLAHRLMQCQLPKVVAPLQLVHQVRLAHLACYDADT